MRKIDWSKIAAAAVAIERIHSILVELSPQYANAIKAASNRIRRSLRMKNTVADEIIRFMGTTELGICWESTRHFLQADKLGTILYDQFKFEKILFVANKFSEVPSDIISFMMKAEMHTPEAEDWMLSEDVIVPNVPWPYSSLDKLGIEIDEPVATTSVAYGYKLFFSRHLDKPIVFTIRPMNSGSYFQFGMLFRKSDMIEIKQLQDNIMQDVVSFNPFRRMVISYVPSSRSVIGGSDFTTAVRTAINGGSNGAITRESDHSMNEAYAFLSSEPSINFLICQKETIDLRFRKPDLDEELFCPQIKRLIHEDIPGFIDKQESLCRKGFDGRRSYLLAGPPGSGKSNILKNIVAILPKQYTVVIAQSRDLSLLSEFVNCDFISPVLFLIEDIDLIISNGKERQSLLNFLDGLNSPKRMITVMTSNSPHVLGDSLVKRPGRVDRICYVMPGDRNQRAAQIRILTKDIALPGSEYDLADNTEGFTFAQHREVVRRALIYSKTDSAIDFDAFRSASEECRKQFTDDLKDWSSGEFSIKAPSDKSSL